ncbi:hypothetical protein K470DRAFT_257381 [Piedraia hortae CBS 480.64]|uniref:Uncharacterized protein n=1 Tax=Piedraia hortae CBS 480.64 TaxID=1314780 RepID=A0A6A7C1D1_9PEZI|nr:hypothetical protein K470DRAFT_257381 [Piedraia hortae CBS 480.64]
MTGAIRMSCHLSREWLLYSPVLLTIEAVAGLGAISDSRHCILRETCYAPIIISIHKDILSNTKFLLSRSDMPC